MSIPYNETEVSATKFYKFLTNNMPELSVNITSEQQLKKFLYGKHHEDINKVLLLTNKKKSSEQFKALTSEFRDRLRFGVVDANRKDLLSRFQKEGLTKDNVQWPALLVVKGYNVDTKQVEKDGAVNIRYRGKSMEFAEIKEFVQIYARKSKKVNT